MDDSRARLEECPAFSEGLALSIEPLLSDLIQAGLADLLPS